MMRQSTPLSNTRLGSVVMIDESRGSHAVVLSTGLGNIELADTLITSGAIIAAMDDVLAHGQHLEADIRANIATIMQDSTGQRFYNDFITWYPAYQAFYSSHRGTWSAGASYLTGETVATLRSQAAQYNALESRFRSVTGLDPSYNPGAPSNRILPTEAWVAIGIGAGVLTLGFIAWTASSVAKVTGPARALRGRRRR